MNTTPIAFFDFDGTLTRRDTLFPFLHHLCGNWAFAFHTFKSLPNLSLFALGLRTNDAAKNELFKEFFVGIERCKILEAGHSFANEKMHMREREAGMQLLRNHQAQGHDCVLVSASLDAYLAPWARRQGFAACISTQLAQDIQAPRLIDGLNCYGAEKTRRIKQWLNAEQRKPSISFAYGDSSGDTEMLRFANYGYRLKRTQFKPV